jgi:sugar phosphate isomerase/epimerase
VRDKLAQDYVGTLRRVKEIGYDAVELPPSRLHEPGELRGILDDVGLGLVALIVRPDALEEDVDKWIDCAKTLGTSDLVYVAPPVERRATRDGWMTTAAILDRLGARCRERGVTLSYHNHSFEFAQFDGTCALDLLYANTLPQNVFAEIDTYWIKHGGADPVEYIRRHAGRIRILHAKDMADDEERSFAEVGRGILDWPAIHAAAVDAGARYYCVEQDRCPGDSMESARLSFEFMSNLLAGQ